VSRGERGQAALPAERYSRRLLPILTAEPQYRSGTLKRSQFNACQFMGVTPPLLGLACFYGALERFHCDPYPQTPQPSFRTHIGPSRDELRVSLTPGECRRGLSHSDYVPCKVCRPYRAPRYYTKCCSVEHFKKIMMQERGGAAFNDVASFSLMSR
jgi:hypothetical protein